MVRDFLSDEELYFSRKIMQDTIWLEGGEFHHAFNVMRNTPGDLLFVTDGEGNLFKTRFIKVEKEQAELKIIGSKKYAEEFPDVYFVIPIIRKTERFEFALEKLTELGITKIIVYQAVRSVKKAPKLERWNKILLAALKQSLRVFLPEITFIESLKNLNPINSDSVIIFNQTAENKFGDYQTGTTNSRRFFIFGPEGGLAPEEINLFPDAKLLKLTPNRLRSETAIITAAAMLHY